MCRRTCSTTLPCRGGSAVVMTQAGHELTCTYGGRGGLIKRQEAGLAFRTALAMDTWEEEPMVLRREVADLVAAGPFPNGQLFRTGLGIAASH